MPHEDYCYALERENHALNEKYESLRQQLDGWIAANSPNGWIDNLRQQLSTLKAELKCIGEAIDDPRTDLTMTMSELILEYKQQLADTNEHIEYMLSRDKAWADIESLKEQQLAAALAAIKVKDEALNGLHWMDANPKVRYALSIQPDDSALKAWLGEPVAYRYCYQGQDICLSLEPQDAQIPVSYYWQEPLYAPKGM